MAFTLFPSLLVSLLLLTQSVSGCTDQNPCEKPLPPPKPHCKCECDCDKPKKHTPHVPKPPPKSPNCPPPPVPKLPPPPPPKTPNCPPPPVPKPPPPPPPKSPDCPPSVPKVPKDHPPHVPKDYPPQTPVERHCPINTLKLGVCIELLGGLLGGLSPVNSDCCPLILGLVNFEAAVCLCQVVKTDFLGIKIEYDYKFTMLVNHCGCDIPPGFQCA